MSAAECECGHAVARHDEDGCCLGFVVKHDGEAACPCWFPDLNTGCTDDCPEDCTTDHRGEQ